jgi:hypothetical protein
VSRRAVALGLGVIVFVIGSAAPASAHSLTGTQASNYQTRIFGFSPHIPGLHAEVRALGGRIELTNSTRRTVVVEGYQGEPYLRIGPSGVERNQRSPATFLNRTTLLPPGPVPRGYSASAPPQWQELSSGRTVEWHDHRTHWMAPSAPPVVQNDPSGRHVLIAHWVVPLLVDGRPVHLTGEVVWVPGPSGAPWLLLATAAALVVIGADLVLGRARRPVLLVALVAAALAGVVLAYGTWEFAVGSRWARLGSSLYELGAGFMAGIALVLVVRRRRLYDAAPCLLIAGLLVGIGAGLANILWLIRSQLPTTLPHAAGRALVSVSLGIGVALSVVGARYLSRRDPSRPRGSARSRRAPPTARRVVPQSVPSEGATP